MLIQKRLYILLPILAFLSFVTANASTFYINSTQANVNDTFWNSGDEYAPYLSYTNPYAQICSDLRECYIDDTNSGSMVNTNLLRETFFNNDTNLQPATFGYGTYSQKLTNSTKRVYYRGNESYYYLIAIFNDTSQPNLYKAIVQRGTVVDIYENLTFRSQYVFSRSSSGCATMEDDWNIYAVCYSGGAVITYSFFYLSSGQIDLFITMRSISGTAVFDVVSHLKANELSVSSFSAVYGSAYDLAVFGSNMTDFSGAVHLNNVSFYNGTELLIKVPEKYFVLNPDGAWYGYPLHGNDEIRLKPTFSRIATLAGNYRSVALPTCSDIAEGNTQTLLYYQNGYWIRSCEGVVPTPEMEQFTCNLECSQMGWNNTYIEQNKTLGMGILGGSSLSYSSHASIFNRADSYPYIFDTGANIGNIYDLRIYTYIEFETYNDTQRFGVYGVSGLSPVSGTSSYIVCDSTTNECNIPLYTRATPVQSLDDGNIRCYLGSMNFTEYTINNLMTKSYSKIYEPMVSGSSYYYPFTENWYINTWWRFSDVPLGVDCDTLPLSSFPYLTPINSSTKHIYTIATWRNVTGYYPVCVQYESVCTPVVPPDYTYNPEDIICVGQHCYVYAQPTCDNDGTCDFSVGENVTNCPADCTGVTPPVENIIGGAVNSFGYFISLFVGSISTVLGTETVNVKGLVWFIITLVIVVLAAVKAGGLVGTLAFLGFMLIGVLVGWMPFWIGLVFILLAAFATASMATKLIKGD
jgi:hypothetical protein